MSSSSKKKLRKEQGASAMTEKQAAAAKEAKQLKVYTVTFVVVLALIVGIAVGVLVARGYTQSGIREKNSLAVTIGDHKLTAADLSYYYVDAINGFYNNLYSSYGSNTALYAMLLYGVDFTAPLGNQTYDKEANTSWADYFMDEAIEAAKQNYALYDHALANQHKLTEEEEKSITTTMNNMTLYASYYGYSNVDKYLKAVYGYGSSKDTFEEYLRVSTVVSSYCEAHQESLDFKYEDFRKFEEDKFANYSSFTYAWYYLPASDFLTGGTKSEDGKTTTYSDEDWAKAREAVKKAAEEILAFNPANAEQLNAAINTLEIFKDNKTPEACTEDKDILLTEIAETLQEWLKDEKRVAGEIGMIPAITKSKDKDAKEIETINGYYLVLFNERDDNMTKLCDVRHVLVKFEGGKYNSTTGTTTYSDAEKSKAKAEAEKLYNEWKNGIMNENTFSALAKEHSDDGNKSEGGLYEDVYPGQMVPTFNDWCFDPERKAGDHGIVETDFGYHIMFFVGSSDESFRDYMINIDMENEAMTNWIDEIEKGITVTKNDLSKMNYDFVLITG